MATDLVRLLQSNAPYDYIPHKEARKIYGAFRGKHGAASAPTQLLTDPDGNVKFHKTLVPTYGLSLAQATTSGKYNACLFSTHECRAGCVAFAGMGRFDTVQAGRIRRTLFLAEHPDAFFTLLMREIQKVWVKHGAGARVRLNTFSDIPWEVVHPEIFERFPALRFYDYTKWPIHRRSHTPDNYRLCFSASEKTTNRQLRDTLSRGQTVAVVFRVTRTKPLPATYLGFPVIDGDRSDDRWSDPQGVIVGLRAKGLMRRGAWEMSRKVRN